MSWRAVITPTHPPAAGEWSWHLYDEHGYGIAMSPDTRTYPDPGGVVVALMGLFAGMAVGDVIYLPGGRIIELQFDTLCPFGGPGLLGNGICSQADVCGPCEDHATIAAMEANT